MPARRVAPADPVETPRRRGRPAQTPEERENQLIAAAYDLAEKQILDGTASSQVLTQFLKLGSTRERVEQERLRAQVELDRAKIEGLASEKRIEVLFEEATNAMRAYKPSAFRDEVREPEIYD